jgi:hypothetical protein
MTALAVFASPGPFAAVLVKRIANSAFLSKIPFLETPCVRAGFFAHFPWNFFFYQLLILRIPFFRIDLTPGTGWCDRAQAARYI